MWKLAVVGRVDVAGMVDVVGGAHATEGDVVVGGPSCGLRQRIGSVDVARRIQVYWGKS